MPTDTGNPYDVNNDGVVSPLDALLIINYLNAGNPTKVSITAAGSPSYDVNASNEISPLDALLIINLLNAKEANGEGESAAPILAASTFDELLAVLASDPAHQVTRKRRA